MSDITQAENSAAADLALGSIPPALKLALNAHAIVSMTDQRGDIVYVNDKFCAISGYSRAELLGQNHRILRSDEHSETFYTDLWKTIRGGDVWQGEIKNRAKSGEFYWVASTIVPVTDAGGEITHFLSLRTDITQTKFERAKALAALEKLQETQQRQNKIYGVIAHELRTPAASINMMAERQDPSLWQSKQGEVLQSSRDLLNTIDYMRLLLNPDEVRPVRIESTTLAQLNTSIARTVASCIAASGFAFSQLDELPNEVLQRKFDTDGYRLRVALANLINNACLHSKGSRIWVISTLHSSPAGDYLQWSVCDDGVGIPESEIETLFRAGELGSSSVTGMGLGLNIARTWLEEIGGGLNYKAHPEGGCEFTVRLPLISRLKPESELGSANIQVVTPEQIQERLSELRILLVEDDDLQRMLVEDLLTEMGVNVTTAVDGLDGLNTFGPEIDLLVTDHFMPQMTGLELTKTLREQGFDVPIVGLSAATIGDQHEELRMAGADVVLSKPLSEEMFSQVVAELLIAGRL